MSKRKKYPKLYVWEGILCDYTDGMAIALAYSLEEAQTLVLDAGHPLGNPGEMQDVVKRFRRMLLSDLMNPEVVELGGTSEAVTPRAWTVHGGG